MWESDMLSPWSLAQKKELSFRKHDLFKKKYLNSSNLEGDDQQILASFILDFGD